MDLWQGCNGARFIGALQANACRVVESQEHAATLALTDSAEEQALLESLLEASKPPLPAAAHHLHYLLATPFRYPPLRHGSRFGLRTRPGLLYASLRLETALAECAYYRLVFREGMHEPPPRAIVSHHTTFWLRAETERGVHLERPPFDAHRALIGHPARYRDSQALGEAMRAAGVEAFTYPCARADGLNLGVFSPAAIASRRPLRPRAWTARTDAEGVRFVPAHRRGEGYTFPRAQFLYRGRLPAPAV